MIPVLFAKDATNFTTNGLGRLECISCIVTEERNGIYELEAVLPVNGNHVSQVEMDSIIAVIPHDGGTMQGFRVYQMTKPLSGKFTVYARHISYQLLDNPAMPFSVQASPTACASTLAALKANAVETCPFTFWTDVTTAGSYSQTVPAAIRQRLLGSEGSVLDQFGGEYEWDNFTVKLHNKRGRPVETTGITLRYGKNITDLEQEEEITNVITGVVPFWADTSGNRVTLPERAVYSQYRDNYPFRRTEPLDLSDKWQDAPSEASLRAAAQAFVNNSELGLPKVSIEVSFVALWQSEEYKDVLPLQRVQLCDEINVIFEKYNISRTAKVVKTVYNVLKDRYDSIQVGALRSSFASAITDMNANTLMQIDAQSVSVEQAINNATKWLTSAGGYVIAIKNTDGTWKELIFSNMTDPYDSNAKILRVNNNGIGFSLNGMNGTFRNAWTIDGNLVADFIHGGTLTLGGNNNGNGVMSFVDGNAHEIIRIDRTGAYLYTWTYANGTWTKTIIGSWTPSGIDVKKGSINGAGITLGGSNNASGTLTIKDANGNTIGTWNNGGINVNAGIVALGNKRAIDDGNTGVYIGSGGIGLGAKTGSLTRSPFKVDSNGNLYATSAEVSGKVTVTSGSMNINNNFIVSDQGAVTIKSGSLNINNAFQVSAQGKLTATGADIGGKITANDGKIGNFTITSSNGMYNGKAGRDDSSNGVYIGTNGIALGANSKFKVDQDGNLNATAANIRGQFNNQAQDGGSVNMNGGVLTVHNAGGASGYIRLELGDEEVIMNEHEVSWTDGDHYVKAKWSDIIGAFDTSSS